MGRVLDRQESSNLSLPPSLYLNSDRDSGYTEPDSDQDFSSHPPSRVVYPFSDDEDLAPCDTTTLVTTPNYHILQADQAIGAVRQYAHEKEWKKVLKHKSGVVVYMVQKQIKGDKLAVFKGELVIRGFTPQSVFYVIGMRTLWDDQFEDGNLVQNLDETTSITYESYRANGSSRAYDVTLVEKIDCSNDGVIVFACTSVNTNQVAKVPGKTRQEVKLHGWILRLLPTTPPSTHVTFITAEYIQNWIPGFTKKSLARKPLVIASIDGYLKHKAQTSTQQQEQQPSTPTNKLLSPLSAHTRRRPSIMERQSPSSPIINEAFILTNPPPRRSSLNPQQPPSRSSSLQNNKRITFADDVTILSHTSTDNGQQLNSSSYLQLPQPELPSKEKLYPPARHRSARKESLINYKRLYSSDIEEWKELGDRDGVKMYSKPSQGSALPILRGDGRLEGSWTVEQVCSVIQCFGARTKWDDHFENGRIVERFSQKEYLVYLQMKSIFPINSRDYSILTQIDSDARSKTIHVVSTSVTDSITPEMDAHTRGRMLIYGWTIQADTHGGIKLTFISHLDLAGTTPLPSAIVRLFTTELPLYVHRVEHYLLHSGCPPYIRRVAGKVLTEDYDPDTHNYNMTFIAKYLPARRQDGSTWCTDIRLHSSVYKGFKVTAVPQDGVVVIKDKGGIRIYTNKNNSGATINVNVIPAEEDGLQQDSVTTSVHLQDSDKQETCHQGVQGNGFNGLPVDTSTIQTRPRSNSMIIIGDQLSFNGPQLSVILLLMAISYYVGKFSCRC
ncbi:hypothetical protein BC941DRAFT_509274 [Chlamydoabsidia padenii]|nr:hypothetical protein BC941DRAFT_509274 [Chlamydoabsidia padenii]